MITATYTRKDPTMKRHARPKRRPFRLLSRFLSPFLSRNHVFTTWKDPLGRPSFRMGRNHGKYYIERRYLHYPGLAGLTVRRHVSKAEALAFTPDLWADPQ